MNVLPLNQAVLFIVLAVFALWPARVLQPYDVSISSDPTVVVTINMAIQVYENLFSNPINVQIYFQAGSGLGG